MHQNSALKGLKVERKLFVLMHFPLFAHKWVLQKISSLNAFGGVFRVKSQDLRGKNQELRGKNQELRGKNGSSDKCVGKPQINVK